MKTIDEKLAVMRGWLDGKQIHNKAYVDLSWSIDNFPEWDFEYYDYRIKPEPTGSERVRKLLNQNKPVLCVTGLTQETADSRLTDLHYYTLVNGCTNNGFSGLFVGQVEFAAPVDLSQFAQESK